MNRWKRHWTVTALVALCGPAALAGCGKSHDVRARRYDPVRDCWGEYEVVGETSDEVCTLALELALSPHGDCFQFNDGCLPAGFERIQGQGPDGCSFDAPACGDCTDAGCPARR